MDGHLVQLKRQGVTQPGERTSLHTQGLAASSSGTDRSFSVGYVQVIEEEGMPAYDSPNYGDLYIEYNVVLPSTLSTDMKRSEFVFL